MSVIAYTSANLQYLDRALVLERTLRQTNPTWHLVLVLVDEYPQDPVLRAALARFDEVLLAEKLFPAGFRQWIFMHDVVEACTAVKGAALEALLKRDPEAVVYLDPDIAVFSDMTEIVARLSESDICLTPHQLEPDNTPKALEDNELGSLKTGVFNLGFLMVKPSAEGKRFAKWWADRLWSYCVDDPARGLFTDQKWMDHAPVFFPSTAILRDPGLNVASWNLSKRSVFATPQGEYEVNGRPLFFWHFTKARTLGELMTLRYGARDEAVAELWRFYLEAMNAEGSELDLPSWSFSSFSNGCVIPSTARRLYRTREDLQIAFEDPFEAEQQASFFSWLSASGEWDHQS